MLIGTKEQSKLFHMLYTYTEFAAHHSYVFQRLLLLEVMIPLRVRMFHWHSRVATFCGTVSYPAFML